MITLNSFHCINKIMVWTILNKKNTWIFKRQDQKSGVKCAFLATSLSAATNFLSCSFLITVVVKQKFMTFAWKVHFLSFSTLTLSGTHPMIMGLKSQLIRLDKFCERCDKNLVNTNSKQCSESIKVNLAFVPSFLFINPELLQRKYHF